MIGVKPHSIELLFGYTDKSNVTHKRVTFGKLLKGKQIFDIDDDPQSNLPTQAEDLILRAAITEFGSLTMPVTLQALLNLNSLDRDDLNEGYAEFIRINQGDAKPEQLDEDKVKLAFGYERNGLVYDIVRFGHLITGMDEIEADRKGLKGIRRVCFLVGRQVCMIEQSEGNSELPGTMGLDIFENLHAVDVQVIRVASEVYRQFFRRVGATAQGNGQI